MALIQRFPWTVQPQVAAELSTSWRARTVWFFGAGVGAYDVKTKTQATFGGVSASSFVPTGKGITVATTGGGVNYARWQSNAVLSEPFTLAVRARRNDVSSGASDSVWNTCATDTTNSSLSLRIAANGYSAPNTPFATVRNSGGTQIQALNASGAGLSATVFQTIWVVHDGANLSVHLDNSQVATAAGTVFPGTMAQPITLGTQGSESKAAAVDVAWAHLMTGALNATQRAQYSPWDVFAPRTRTIWVPTAAGGGGFKSAWARGANTLLIGGRV